MATDSKNVKAQQERSKGKGILLASVIVWGTGLCILLFVLASGMPLEANETRQTMAAGICALAFGGFGIAMSFPHSR